MSTLEKDKRPSMQWYPGDWMKDADLCGVSTTARGALMDVLCLMFECEERGVLSSNGSAWTIERLAQAIRGDYELNITAIRELCSAGVLRRRSDGALFSKRMVRDEAIRNEKARAGRIGGQAKRKQKPSKTEAKGVAKRGSSSSSSSSASSSSLTAKENPPPTPPGGSACTTWEYACGVMKTDVLKTPEFKKAWLEYVDECPKMPKGGKLTERAVVRRIRKLERFGHDDAIGAIEDCLETTKPNLFRPRTVSGSSGESGNRHRSREGQGRDEAPRLAGLGDPEGNVAGTPRAPRIGGG